MQVIISDNYLESSIEATNTVIELMQKKSKPMICVASGDSPAGIYQNLVTKVKQQELNIQEWRFLGLDEWVGMNGQDEGSCRYHLNAQLFSPLQIPANRICFFDGAAKNLEEQCSITESAIEKQGGIDVAILGLGLNGHIGMNEPHTSASTRSHIVELDPLTAQVGQKYFKSAQTLTHGITLGIASLMEAKAIILVVNGEKKAAILKQLINSEVTESLPASILHLHPNCFVYADKSAASLL